jgi:glycosyltransferase involved in cell wall biosynthesis
MLRIVVEASRRVLVHNDWLAEQIREAHHHTAVDVVEMGVPETASRPGARQRIRSRHRIAEDAVVFTAFGKVTPEKRVREAMRALATVAETVPHAHLLVAGETVEHYDLRAAAETLGVRYESKRVSIRLMCYLASRTIPVLAPLADWAAMSRAGRHDVRVNVRDQMTVFATPFR